MNERLYKRRERKLRRTCGKRERDRNRTERETVEEKKENLWKRRESYNTKIAIITSQSFLYLSIKVLCSMHFVTILPLAKPMLHEHFLVYLQ